MKTLILLICIIGLTVIVIMGIFNSREYTTGFPTERYFGELGFYKYGE